MYCANERPRLPRSAPPELTKREKLLRGVLNLFAAALGGIGGGVGGVGIAAGCRGAGGDGPSGGGVGAGDGLPPAGSQLGISGVPPPWPPFAFEVPISAFGLAVASAEWP
jgi:hypothetical protein